jgi:hypothetical protein
MKWIFLGVGLSLLPIWRVASKQGIGLNFWSYLKESTSDEYQSTHIPYEQAVMECREAWLNSEK